ncbi:MAG: DUF1501 domain-containing protein [Candidatus Latescibacteria bacterium]|nr:DUF1501 domain-containing protein [Candidatus Latescibacterota bacterium]
MALASVGGALTCQNTTVQAVESFSPLAKIAAETERTLVLIQLAGGNDGVNTVIPYEDDQYYNRRPSLAIDKANAVRLDDTMGLHPSLEPLQGLWADGRMAVVQNVGYPDPSLSHFRSTDIWTTASHSDQYLETGWGGRFLEEQYADFAENPPEAPLAVQIGGSSSLLFQGPSADISMTMANPESFQRLASQGLLYDTQRLPRTAAGEEMEFVRTVANNSFGYAKAVKQAADLGANGLDYESGSSLSRNLAAVARLIKGGLNTRIYLVRLGGFDTHTNQAGAHANLLRQLGQAVRDFYTDLALGYRSGNVAMMTFSEFGRRVDENGARGTDHGTAAPVLLFGDAVRGGLHGEPPDLTGLDRNGNLPYQTDFRTLYATLFRDWFRLAPATTTEVLGGDFGALPIIDATHTGVASSTGLPFGVELEQNFPNPFNAATTIRYTLPIAAPVRLEIFNNLGQQVAQLVDAPQAAGTYTVEFNTDQLASGAYFYQLKAGVFTQKKKMTLMK